MVVGEVAEREDVIVVGGGPGGYAAAIRAAQLGRKVVLVERDAIGGVCLNVGCIPSKALIEVADRYHAATATGEAPWAGLTLSASLDWNGVQDHLRGVAESLSGGVHTLLEANGVRVLRGTARFLRPGRIVVDPGGRAADGSGAWAGAASHHDYDQVILATGSRPVAVPGLALDGERVVDSTGALFATTLPASLAVVGGGYIGVELGTAFAKLGVAVTIVELTERLLPGIDARLAQVVTRRLKALGVAVHTGTRALGVTERGLLIAPAEGSSATSARAATHEPAAAATTARELEAERIVVAVGRRPNSDDLGLDHVGVTVDATGRVVVDARRVAARGICAIGDLTDGPALAHKASAEAEVAARTACGIAASFDPAAIPAVVFSDPEVVTVGPTVEQAEAAGAEGVRSFRFPFAASGRAATMARPAGHAELVADGAGTILGAHLVGAHVSELAGECALAIELAATVEDLAATVHPHPTLSEALAEAAHGLEGFPLHVALVRRRG